MGLALYTDVHVPYAVTTTLLNRGVDVLTAQMDKTTRLPDPELLDRASSLGRVLVSQDVDFLVEAASRQRRGKFFAGLIFAQQRSITTSQFIAHLELVAKTSEPNEMVNRVEFLPL